MAETNLFQVGPEKGGVGVRLGRTARVCCPGARAANIHSILRG
jgi:hypothetical protein